MLREAALTRATAKTRTAPSAPRQGQCSTKIELSRTLRVISPLAGRSVFAGGKAQRLHPRAQQKTTAQPPSFEVTPRVRRICPGLGRLARGLTLVVVTLLTSRQRQTYDFWRAPGEPLPKPSVTLDPPTGPAYRAPCAKRTPGPGPPPQPLPSGLASLPSMRASAPSLPAGPSI